VCVCVVGPGKAVGFMVVIIFQLPTLSAASSLFSSFFPSSIRHA
jgi:hypothetical protein